MKKKLLTTAILLTGLISASTYHYTFKISDTSLFNNSQQASNGPTMQNATPQERTGIPSTGVILASDGGVDWYGEVSSENLISGDDLATLIGLTAGTSQHSDAGWLHVGLNNTQLLISKKPIRFGLNLSHISDVNAVYGNRIITINNKEYKIRLFKGATSNPPSSITTGFDVPHTHGSEWNRIMYRLTNDTYVHSGNLKSSEGDFNHLAYYSEEDFVLSGNFGNGNYNWCQETSGIYGVNRGGAGVSFFNRSTMSPLYNALGWRPILEKVN